jgi:hypothetical protein
VKQISYVLLALFGLLLLLFVRKRPLSLPPFPRTRRVRSYVVRAWQATAGGEGLADPYAYAAVAFTLFLLLSKVVYEQYFLWPLPFLAILVVRDRSRMATLLLAVLSVTGLLANDWIHPFGYRPAPALWLNALIAVAAASFVVSRLRVRAPKQAVGGRR